MTRLEIPVEGMHCDGCARTISIALQRVEGVRDAKAEFDSGLVKVRLDPQRVSEEQIRETIEACGYRPLAPDVG